MVGKPATRAMRGRLSSRAMTVSDGRTDVLIVGASAPDLVGLRGQLGDSLEGSVRGLLVRSKVVGFGVGVAGAATARGLLAMTPRAVVQIGTCGVYPHQAEYRPYELGRASAALRLRRCRRSSAARHIPSRPARAALPRDVPRWRDARQRSDSTGAPRCAAKRASFSWSTGVRHCRCSGDPRIEARRPTRITTGVVRCILCDPATQATARKR